MKQTFWKISALFAALLTGLLVFGCGNVFEPPVADQPQAGATLVLTINGSGSAKTILPTEVEFNAYKVKIVQDKDADGVALTTPVTKVDATWIDGKASETFLGYAFGGYTITVQGFTDVSATVLVAQAVTTVTLDGLGGTKVVNLNLAPIETGTGTFAWDITLATGITTASMVVQTTPPQTAVDLKTTATSSTLSLPVGVYSVEFTLGNGTKTVVWVETLHIYSNLTSTFEWEFDADLFLAPSFAELAEAALIEAVTEAEWTGIPVGYFTDAGLLGVTEGNLTGVTDEIDDVDTSGAKAPANLADLKALVDIALIKLGFDPETEYIDDGAVEGVIAALAKNLTLAAGDFNFTTAGSVTVTLGKYSLTTAYASKPKVAAATILAAIKDAELKNWVNAPSVLASYPQDKAPAEAKTVLYYVFSKNSATISVTPQGGWEINGSPAPASIPVNGATPTTVTLVYPAAGVTEGTAVNYSLVLTPVAQYNVTFAGDAEGKVSINDGSPDEAELEASGNAIGLVAATTFTTNGNIAITVKDEAGALVTLSGGGFTPTSQVYTVAVDKVLTSTEALEFIEAEDIKDWVVGDGLASYPQDKVPLEGKTHLYIVYSEADAGKITLDPANGWAITGGNEVTVSATAIIPITLTYANTADSTPATYVVEFWPVAQYDVVFASRARGTITIEDKNPIGNGDIATVTATKSVIGVLGTTEVKKTAGSISLDSITPEPTAFDDSVDDTFTFTAESKVYTIAVGNTATILTYVISGSGTSFSATGGTLAAPTANATMANTLTSIRTDAGGEDVLIQFGDGTTALSTGAAAVFDNAGWGVVTLTGKITATTSAVTIGTDGGVSVTVNIENAVFSSNASAATVLIVKGNSSEVTIKDSTITNTGAADNARRAVGIGADGSGTLSSAKLTLINTAVAVASGGVRALYIAGDSTVVVTLLGTTTVTGGVYISAAGPKLSVVGTPAFTAPENVISITGTPANAASPIVVKGGAPFLSSFTYTSAIKADGDDIVLQ